MRSETVEHEFVNTNWRLAERLKFAINDERWDASIPGTTTLSDFLTGFLRDLGAGLEIPLYEEAAMHCFGGKELVERDVRVQIADHSVGKQRMRLIAPGVAFKITALDDSLADFETHARRLLSHADLRAIAWGNINLKQATFTTLTP
ncbi:MAG: hypothetical protein ACKV2Q_25905 [Planctomycetaceae bacterium]